MVGLERLRYHVSDDPTEEGPALSATAFRGGVDGDDASDNEPVAFNSDEGAARFYLDELLMRDGRPTMRSVAAPERPERAAGLALQSAQDLPATSTRIVRFEQRHDDIPVFGAQALVELDSQRSLVSADVRVAEVGDIGHVPSIRPEEAVAAVASFAETELEAEQLPPLSLVYYHDDAENQWHLAWLVRDVPGIPAEARPEPGDRSGHGLGQSFRALIERADYLVDAHDATVLFYYGRSPTVGIPVKCKGTDEGGNVVEFFGSQGDGAFMLHDPLRRVRTFDFKHGDIFTSQPPTDPVANPKATFGDEHRGAVTAHFHATVVQDFYKKVLQRDGIDDKGMELVSVVNTTNAQDQPPPQWKNAAWFKDRMWYGQVKDQQGRLVSLARFLDVIAHELTHGVIDTTSDLVYQGQSGALNESFADVFGVIIANSTKAPQPDDVATWDWRIGAGLGPNGDPLRNFADPSSLGDPDHMDRFLNTTADFGGVHTNSSIHNKAIHALLTTGGTGGAPALSVHDVATVLYLSLVRLNRLATFADARQTAVDVAKVFWSGDQAQMTKAVAAIEAAYDSVGIT